MSRSFLTRLPYLAVALCVILLDRATKGAVSEHLAPRGSLEVVPGLLDLTYVRNPGGVFGLFRDVDEDLRSLLFTAVPLLAIVLIVAYARRVRAEQRLSQTALFLILGGAVGNLTDRFRFGYVIDFLDVHWRGYHWPAFNVADSAICVGVGMLMLETLRAPRHAGGSEAGSESAEGAGVAPGDLP